MTLSYQPKHELPRRPWYAYRSVQAVVALIAMLIGLFLLRWLIGSIDLRLAVHRAMGVAPAPGAVVFQGSTALIAAPPGCTQTNLLDSLGSSQFGYVPPQWTSLLTKLGNNNVVGPLLYADEQSDGDGGNRIRVLTFQVRAGIQLAFSFLTYDYAVSRRSYQSGQYTFSVPVERRNLWNKPMQIFAGHMQPGDPSTIVMPCKIGSADGEFFFQFPMNGTGRNMRLVLHDAGASTPVN